MAKQTFTVGQVLTAAQMTSLQQTAMGGGSTTAKTASYTLVAADAGTVVQMNSASATTITVNTALFAAGDTVQIQNIGAGVCTVTAGTATVSTAGSLALSQYEGGQLYFNTTSAALFFDLVQSAAAGGKVLQVIEGTASTQSTTASSTFSDTGLTATITPSAATSKILVLVSITGIGKSASDTAVGLKLLRNAVVISEGKLAAANSASSTLHVGSQSINKLDAPSLTSAIVYKVQYNSQENTGTAKVMGNSSESSIVLMEIGA